MILKRNLDSKLLFVFLLCIVLIFAVFFASGEEEIVASEKQSSVVNEQDSLTDAGTLDSILPVQEVNQETESNQFEGVVQNKEIDLPSKEQSITDNEENNFSDEVYLNLDEVYLNLDEVYQNSSSNDNSNDNSNLKNQEINNEDEPKINEYETVVQNNDINSGNSNNYEYFDIENITNIDNNISEEISDNHEENITFLFYRDNEKETETIAEFGSNLSIKKEEKIILGEEWKKEVKVYSENHHENPVEIYSKIVETKKEDIRLYWKEESRYLDFESFDENNNGLIDKISWIAPHLSEQNFEITINLEKNQNGSDSIDIVSDISQTTFNSSILDFDFNISYNNQTICEFSIMNSVSLIRNDSFISNNFNYSLSLANGNYSWNISCYDLNNYSIYNSKNGSFSINVDYSPKIFFYSDKNSLDYGSQINFFINITSFSPTIKYLLNFGDGSILVNSGSLNLSSINTSIAHTYAVKGNYTAILDVFIDGSDYEKTLTINVKDLNKIDDQKPIVLLLAPEDNEKITTNNLNFSYKVDDNVKTSNCTLSIYYYNGVIGSLFYTNIKEDLSNNQTIIVERSDLEEGSYSWDVRCYDNSSNYKESSRDFEVKRENTTDVAIKSYTGSNNDTNYSSEYVEKIDELISSIGDFMINEEKYNPEEKKVINDLGIVEDIKNYKKRLLQMKLDLDHNIDYIRDEDTKKIRKNEIIESIDKIGRSIPKEVKLIDNYDYYKNSLDLNLLKIVEDYFKLNGLVIQKKDINQIAQNIESIQKKAIISTEARQVEISYIDRTDKITLVTKNIEIKNDSFDKFLEILPLELYSNNEIIFINVNKSIGEGYFELKKSDLVDGKIIYYLKNLVDFSDIEKTNTVVFQENLPKNTLEGITGFASFIDGSNGKGLGFYISWIMFSAMILAVMVVSTNKLNVYRISNKPIAKEIIAKINKSKILLDGGEVEKTKEEYNAIRKLYSNSGDREKKILYGKIEDLRIKLDKKEIIILVKSLVCASKEGKKRDAQLIYEKIKNVYSRLSEKDKIKVYEKILPYINDFTN